MPSTSDYINQLKTDKENLVNNLISKGVEANNEETFTSLVPKILDIQGSSESEYNAVIDGSLYPTFSSSDEFLIKRMITKIPKIDTSKWTSLSNVFKNCENLEEIPLLNTSNVTNFQYAFYNCKKLKTIPLSDTGKATTFYQAFYYCNSLKTFPQINMENVTDMYQMFYECQVLTDIPSLNTSKVKDMRQICIGCTLLKNVGLLDASSVNLMQNPFYRCSSLENFEGFKDLGKGYTQKTANYSSYSCNVSTITTLTHDSLMNIINNLYDLNLTYGVANGGTLYTQQLVLGSTNLAKLSADEIAVATNKGWSVS